MATGNSFTVTMLEPPGGGLSCALLDAKDM